MIKKAYTSPVMQMTLNRFLLGPVIERKSLGKQQQAMLDVPWSETTATRGERSRST
ncbi:hypothetical protein JCM19039_3938 [Geomicrobium sp. JCM 19039]|nr:hypothetical protein JCM19039_3938 [Geomicrobium sp. JCM 19039]